MRLVCQLELPFHVVQPLLIRFDTSFGFALAILPCFLGRLNFLEEVVMSDKQLLSVDLADLAERDVRNFVLETSVDVHAVV